MGHLITVFAPGGQAFDLILVKSPPFTRGGYLGNILIGAFMCTFVYHGQHLATCFFYAYAVL